jgi:hypothetical protein
MLLLFSLESIAQTYQENLEKYWYYRHRLKTNWMFDSGTNQQGDNNIPENIGLYEDCIAGFTGNYLRYGDQTWLLGHYMGVLATEYRLLSANGQDVSETLHDIHRALQTLERLDLTGEECFPGGIATENGFFIRDDVPRRFEDNLPDVDYVLSDYINVCGQQDHGNEMSQDQVWGLFIGLRLLKEFVDVSEYNISWRVKHNTDLIINAMHFTDWIGIEEWVILNPVTGEPVSAGDNVKALSWAFAKVATDITGTNQQTGTSLLWKPVFETSQKTILNQFPISAPSCFDCSQEKDEGLDTLLAEDGTRSPYNAYGILVLTALTDHMVDWPNFIDAYQYLNWVNLETRKGGGYYNMEKGLYPHLMALNKVLHGNIVPNIGAGFYEFFLNSAPPCGAYHYLDEDDNHINSNPPWHTISLFSPQHCCAYDEVNRGHANMVDYMLLYNLYFINYLEGELPYKKITADFPTRNTDLISSKEKQTEVVTAARQLDIYSNVFPTGDVTFIAGEKIRFMPGFHANKNSHVHACIDSSLNNDVYFYETDADPCGGQNSVCDKYDESKEEQKPTGNTGKEKIIITDTQDFIVSQDDFILVYPNPAKDFINVKSSEIIHTVALQSMDGKTRINGSINDNFGEINLTMLPSGLYVLKIRTENKLLTEKIIKK